MCCCMGSHFHDWIDYSWGCIFNGVSIMGSTFSDFWVRKFLQSGALGRAKRAQRSTMGKKIWLSMHPRNFVLRKSSVRTRTPSCKPG